MADAKTKDIPKFVTDLQAVVDDILAMRELDSETLKTFFADPEVGGVLNSFVGAFSGIVTKWPYTRWQQSMFYEGRRRTVPTLQEIHNLRDKNTEGITDIKDVDLAATILLRSDLLGQEFAQDLKARIAMALFMIPDPTRYVNPDHGL